MSKFLDSTGVSHLISLIKTAISNKKASVTDSNPTLAWGTKSKVATIDTTEIHVTMPSNPNTDTKVTSAANHYSPTKDNNATKTASGATGTAGATVQVITAIETDGKGHVTGIVSGAATDSRPVTSVNSKTGAVSLSASDVSAIPTSEKGVANGVATLDADGKVPSSQLPAYVDDVIDLIAIATTAPSTCAKGDKYYNSSSGNLKIYTATAANTWGSTGATPEKDKIYVNTGDGKTYRWSGSAMAEISASLALGETSSTAYRGDRGKTAYDHSQSTHARTDATKTEASSTNGNIKINGTETTVYTHPTGTNPHGTTKSDVGLGNVGNFKAVSTEASQGLSSTEKSNARANIGAGTSSFSGSYNDLSNKPTIPTVNNATFSVKTKVGSNSAVTAADFTANQSSADDITLIQGSNVTLTTDTTNRTVTIAATDTTYSAATQSAAGLMSSTDKTKLDGIATGATAVTESTVSGWGFTKNAGTLTSHQTIKQNAITGATGNDYVACSTAAATAAKTGNVTNGTPALEAGLHVFVKFTNANTAANPTLNINSKGAKAIYYDGAAIATDTAILGLLSGLCEFEYDGTQWHLINKTAALTNDDIDTLWTAA